LTEEALDALWDDHDPDAQPDIDLIPFRFAALAKKWAPRSRKTQYAHVNAAFRTLSNAKREQHVNLR